MNAVRTTPTYSFVIPVHNEEEVLDELFAQLNRLRDRLDGPSEVVFVDDGSADASWQILSGYADCDPSCVLVRLSRNFGHQVAVTAGLDNSSGDAVVIMDADLQDPPEVVLEMSAKWRDGFDVVYGVRTDRQTDTPFKRATADAFYRLLNRLSEVDIPSQVGDFRLIDRKVVEALAEMPERNRYVRGMFAWLGFRQVGVEYARPARAAGTTSYSVAKMVKLAGDGAIGYSKTPIRAATLVGAGLASVGAVAGVASAVKSDRSPSFGAAFAGLQLVAIGLIGEYVGRIFDESLDRPLYVTQEVRRHEPQPATDMDRSGRRADDNVRSILERNGAEITETHPGSRNGTRLVETHR